MDRPLRVVKVTITDSRGGRARGGSRDRAGHEEKELLGP